MDPPSATCHAVPRCATLCSYEMPNDPDFRSSRLSLLDRGITFAIAHVRGGGARPRAAAPRRRRPPPPQTPPRQHQPASTVGEPAVRGGLAVPALLPLPGGWLCWAMGCAGSWRRLSPAAPRPAPPAGEMGRRWYEDGKYLRKKNTFTDFIACAEHLVAHKYTSPQRLCIEGRSGGWGGASRGVLGACGRLYVGAGTFEQDTRGLASGPLGLWASTLHSLACFRRP